MGIRDVGIQGFVHATRVHGLVPIPQSLMPQSRIPNP